MIFLPMIRLFSEGPALIPVVGILRVRGVNKYYTIYYYFQPEYIIIKKLFLHLTFCEHITIRNIRSNNHMHNTPKFTWKPKWEKNIELFLMYIKNTFIGSTKLKIR
jgi:hypothetical protein